MSDSDQQVVSLFSDLVSRDDAAINLPAAALAIARVHYPDLDIQSYVDTLAGLARTAVPKVRASDPVDRLAELNDVMFDDFGFRGNRESYYDPRNSFLNDVLERRLGIPITLALVYMEVGRACGMRIDGVGFPGHFLVRDTASGEVLDPFNAGVLLTDADCKRLLTAQGIDEGRWDESLMRPVSKREMLLRMINNLTRHYGEARDGGRLALLEAMAAALDDSDEDRPPSMVH